MAALKYINTNEIFSHPDNPRKDLGDLTELADSIKANGILQNLTVVRGHHLSVEEWQELAEQYQAAPSEELRCQMNDRKSKDGYTAVIGHRRLAAAKLAGLEQVPCIISDMSPNEQLATMLLENMQRSDLTLYEQAQGFQLMLDMGDTVGSIAQKTGFSKSTVRNRVKLLELDNAKLQKALRRSTTLQDYMKLEDIKDIDLKNKVLDTIGTSNFQYELRRALDKEQENKNRETLVKQLETFATEVNDPHDLVQVRWISLSGELKFEKPEDAGVRKYFFNKTKYGSIVLYTERTEQDEATHAKAAERQQSEKERKRQLDQIAERAYDLRFDFIKGLSGLKKIADLVKEFLVQSVLLLNSDFDYEQFSDLLDLDFDFDNDEEFTFDSISEQFKASPERVLLMVAYANFEDGANEKYHDWAGKHMENGTLDMLYNYLTRFGYEMSDEEKAYQNGTHELFAGGACDE